MFHGFVEKETKSRSYIYAIILIGYDVLVGFGFAIFEGIMIPNITFGPMLATIIYTLLVLTVLLITITKKSLRLLNVYRCIRFFIGVLFTLGGLSFLVLFAIYVKAPQLATKVVGHNGSLALSIVLLVLATIQWFTAFRFNKMVKEMVLAKDERNSQSLQLSTSTVDTLGMNQITRISDFQSSLR